MSFVDFLGKLELFSRTGENRFVFNLFDLLLCGIIILVILWRWRARAAPVPVRSQLFLFLAFLCLGASFAVGAALTGAFFFFQKRFSEAPFDVLTHSLQVTAWLLLAASAYDRSPRGKFKPTPWQGSFSTPLLLFATLGLHFGSLLPRPAVRVTAVMDLTNLVLLVFVMILFYRRPLGGRQLGTFALVLFLVAALLRLASRSPEAPGSVVLWNLEQFAWLLSLFTFALAIGEASQDLFGKVFVRLQIAFILLASLMILVITQTEKTEYLATIRSRSDRLAEFVRAHVEHFYRENDSLPWTIEREDFLQRLTLGFGELPELKNVRITVGSQVAIFEIADNGVIHRSLETDSPPHSSPSLDSDAYFLIQALPLRVAKPGDVEFYGTREFLNQHIRKRIILIFSLFTGMVALSTLMIGLVVRGASATIRQQGQEIERAQRQLLQASKLAAVGELAAGVAHEINNPATAILSRATFLLSQQDANHPKSDREDLESVAAQAQRIAQITRGLLLFSRPQALDIKAVPVERVIETSLRSVQNLLAAAHIAVEKNIGLDLPWILADEDNLARALENIFRNGIDAMPSGGTLRIHVAKDDLSGARLRLEISDTGIGIKDENLPRIFDPFFTTKGVGKGTGLGLSITHGIIKEHGGTIVVESRPGAGTRFMIVLPAER